MLERELMMPCLFLLSTDESDSEGGKCSLSHLSGSVALEKSTKVLNIHTNIFHVETGATCQES